MRDNSEGMIEFIDAFEREGRYFSIVGVPEGISRTKFQFGISRAGYVALKKILSFRPLTNMPGLKYRYFCNRSIGRRSSSAVSLSIRCEVEGKAKSFDFEIPEDLASNLQWVIELEDFDDARHLQLEI